MMWCFQSLRGIGSILLKTSSLLRLFLGGGGGEGERERDRDLLDASSASEFPSYDMSAQS